MERPSLGSNYSDDPDDSDDLPASPHPELTPDPDHPGHVIYRGMPEFPAEWSIEEIRRIYEVAQRHKRKQAHTRITYYHLPIHHVAKLLMDASDFIEVDHPKNTNGGLDENTERGELTYFDAYVRLKPIGRSKQATEALFSLNTILDDNFIELCMVGDEDYDRMVQIADSVLKEYEFTP